MQVEVIERDVRLATATLRFTHNGVTVTQAYNLKFVVPGTETVFAAYGVEFNEAMQQTVIDRLTAQVQQEIEQGILHNAP